MLAGILKNLMRSVQEKRCCCVFFIMLPSPAETRASLILRLPDAADAAAWDELVAIYAPLVYRLAVQKGMQPSDADDLVQEVFTAIARFVADWLERPDRGSFRAWLLTIARNAATCDSVI